MVDFSRKMITNNDCIIIIIYVRTIIPSYVFIFRKLPDRFTLQKRIEINIHFNIIITYYTVVYVYTILYKVFGPITGIHDIFYSPAPSACLSVYSLRVFAAIAILLITSPCPPRLTHPLIQYSCKSLEVLFHYNNRLFTFF